MSVKLPPPIPDLLTWSRRPPGWNGDWDETRRPDGWTAEKEIVARQTEPRPLPELVPADEFAAVDEPGAEPLVGDENGTVVAADGDAMFYGAGGAGKTSLVLDLGCHLAAGDPWLGLPIPNAACVALIENEGPRPLFRAKLRRKLDGWTGSPIDGRLHVLEEPWAQVDFADPDWRDALAAVLRYLTIDVLIAGPLTRLGMDEAGTLQHTRDFMKLVADLRERTCRRLAVILVHHEGKSGTVSGAWEGAGDTLAHVQAQGHGRTRLFWQKARWSSEHHGTSTNLLWTDGEGFTVEDPLERPDDETIAELILARVREDPGTGWTKIRETIKGVGNDEIDTVRDGLFDGGRLVNRVGDELLRRVEPRRAARLYLPDDPTIAHLCQAPGIAPAQSVLPLAAEGAATSVPCATPIGGTQGTGTADTPPRDEELGWR